MSKIIKCKNIASVKLDSIRLQDLIDKLEEIMRDKLSEGYLRLTIRSNHPQADIVIDGTKWETDNVE